MNATEPRSQATAQSEERAAAGARMLAAEAEAEAQIAKLRAEAPHHTVADLEGVVGMPEQWLVAELAAMRAALTEIAEGRTPPRSDQMERNRRQLALNTIDEYDRYTAIDQRSYPTDLIHNLADHLSCLLGIPPWPVRARAMDAKTSAGGAS